MKPHITWLNDTGNQDAPLLDAYSKTITSTVSAVGDSVVHIQVNKKAGTGRNANRPRSRAADPVLSFLLTDLC